MNRAINRFKKAIILGLAAMMLISSTSVFALIVTITGSAGVLTKTAQVFAGSAICCDVWIDAKNGNTLAGASTPIYSTDDYRTATASYTGLTSAYVAGGVGVNKALQLKSSYWYY